MNASLKKAAVEEGSTIASVDCDLEKRIFERYGLPMHRWYQIVAEEEVTIEFAENRSQWNPDLERLFLNTIHHRSSDKAWQKRVDSGFLGYSNLTIADYIRSGPETNPAITKLRKLRNVSD